MESRRRPLLWGAKKSIEFSDTDGLLISPRALVLTRINSGLQPSMK